jgi:ribosomal protein S18 acetylase RimI-like enzyme
MYNSVLAPAGAQQPAGDSIFAVVIETMEDKLGADFVARDFQPGDRVKLVDMYADFEPKRAAQGLPPVSEPKIRMWLDRVLKCGRHFVVEVNGQVRGHVMLIPHEEQGTVELANFLHQSVRNRGIGTRLNELAIRLAREAGCARVWLSVEPGNRAAVRSYEKVGFQRLPGSYWAPEMEMAVVL